MRTAKARLDADRTAKPLTNLVKKVKQGDCVGPRTHSDTLEFREGDLRIPLSTPTVEIYMDGHAGIPQPVTEREIIPTHTIQCRKMCGGAKPLWNAQHPGYNIVGAGNNADNAIRDWRVAVPPKIPHRLTAER